MSDIPKWAWSRAEELSGITGPLRRFNASAVLAEAKALHRAFAEYIAQREQPPVDPDLIEVRKICARVDGPNKAYQFLDGSRDTYPEMEFALAAYKAGKLAKEQPQ